MVRLSRSERNQESTTFIKYNLCIVILIGESFHLPIQKIFQSKSPPPLRFIRVFFKIVKNIDIQIPKVTSLEITELSKSFLKKISLLIYMIIVFKFRKRQISGKINFLNIIISEHINCYSKSFFLYKGWGMDGLK